ncbi:hypothetical protein MUK42_15819 [Musa troglodytarum]|uniref:Uncharacterized protein n=1 Tax=Musa troglodytarum TaxID=320322 RepID=A0A9E7FL74_9LILI|nr:hypothetical protein MUK42_15819 [Musa troglodytarum]
MMIEFSNDLLSNCGNCFARLWRAGRWLWKDSEMPRTLLDTQVLEPSADSKLEVDLYRGSASLELYRGSFLQVAAQRLNHGKNQWKASCNEEEASHRSLKKVVKLWR